MKKSALTTFLGIHRIDGLLKALNESSAESVGPRIGPVRTLLALLIALMPAGAHLLSIYKQNVDIVTVFVGVATILAILFRIRHNIPFTSVKKWTWALSHTHTAFALGCIPTVILLLISPELLIPIPQEGGAGGQPPPLATIVQFILQISVWAGLTEEFIYRGLLISVLRRSTVLGKRQITRDRVAIVVSALVFGLSHYPVWGLPVATTLVGLGIGFGIAYIAIRELLLPLIVYHIIFDILSLTFAFWAHRV